MQHRPLLTFAFVIVVGNLALAETQVGTVVDYTVNGIGEVISFELDTDPGTEYYDIDVPTDRLGDLILEYHEHGTVVEVVDNGTIGLIEEDDTISPE